MRPKYWLTPYHPASSSAHQLAELLPGLLIRRQGSRFRRQEEDVIINWGSTDVHWNNLGSILNEPLQVSIAVSKVATYDRLRHADIRTVQYTTDRGVAQEWSRNRRILGRDYDRGSRGHGITVYEPGTLDKDHKFYCKLVKKQREFRAHVFKDRVFFIQEKLKKRNVEGNYDRYIRSHSRGWCFAFNHFNEHPVPAGIAEISVSALSTLGLDFGAIDLAWSDRSGFTVLEVNTAPGLENTALQKYVEVFKELK